MWRWWSVNTCASPLVSKGCSRHGNKFPIIAGRMKRKLQHAKGCGVVDLAIRLNILKWIWRTPTSAHDKLTNAPRVCLSVWVLRREALVVVIVAIDDDIHAKLIQHMPSIPHVGVIAMIAGVEERVVPVGDGALRRIRGEVGTQPLDLGGRRVDRDVAVEDHHMPGSQIIAVVALISGAGGHTEIVIVGPTSIGIVFMVPGRGESSCLQTAPRWSVAIAKIGVGAQRIRIVASGVDGALDAVQQRSGSLIGR